MISQKVAELFGEIGFKIDPQGIKTFEKRFGEIEKRVRALSQTQAKLDKATVKGVREVSKAQAASTKSATIAENKLRDTQSKAAKEAERVAKHQLNLRNRWLKAQDQAVVAAKKVHDHQMKLMKKFNDASDQSTKKQVTNDRIKQRSQKTLNEKTIVNNRASFFKRANELAVRTGQGKEYRIAEQQRAKLNTMLAEQRKLLEQRTKKSSSPSTLADDITSFQSRLEQARKRAERAIPSAAQAAANRRTFFKQVRDREIRTGQGKQYRLAEQMRKAQALTDKAEQESKKRVAALTRNILTEEGRRLINARRQQILNQQEEAHKARMLMAEQRLANARRNASRQSRQQGFFQGNPNQFYGGLGGALAGTVAGGFGIGSLNKANQNIVSRRIAVQAAAGGGNQGEAAWEWLKDQGNRLGFDYSDLSEEYASLLASFSAGGFENSTTQDVFRGIMERATVLKISPERRKLIMRAVGQMSN